MATVFPLEGLVPQGQTVVSLSDSSLRASVLSRWPDGSAAVVVLAGETQFTAGNSRIILLSTTAAGGTPLTPAQVGQTVTNVTVDCGSAGSAVLSSSSFSSPSKTWWANERVICCRYRVPVGSQATLEAVIDIHAFAGGRAFVEVVLENAKVNAAAVAPAAPGAVGYTAAVSVNGASVASVQTTGHGAFRAWYASTWVGGDPGTEVTHDIASIQAHPLLFRVDQPGTTLTNTAADTYAPWGTGRHRATNMGGGGDHPSIGPLPLWETFYLQNGDRNARRAVIGSALAVLSYNVNYRDTGSGLVPHFDQTGTKSGGWPRNNAEPAWEVAHHPAAGLMAFLCQPSPVFIEIAQKVALWNGMWSSTDSNGSVYEGVFGYWYQTRGKAWGIRSLAHALFLTPDGDPWKAAARGALHRNALLIKQFKDDPKAVLGFVWDYAPGSFNNAEAPKAKVKMWQHHYLATELHKAASAKLLTGSQQAVLNEVADWATLQPVRYVNESVGGQWRVQIYHTPAGENATTIASLPTWGQQLSAQFTAEAPPANDGPWLTSDVGSSTAYSQLQSNNSAGAYYPSYFWAALVAGVERGVPGADAAWNKVIAGVTNLSSWRTGFAANPRWGAYPRNK
jgi:hypothetical protein